MDPGAVGGLGHDLALRGDDLDGVEALLGALGQQQVPVRQGHGHPVVRGLGGVLLDLAVLDPVESQVDRTRDYQRVMPDDLEALRAGLGC